MNRQEAIRYVLDTLDFQLIYDILVLTDSRPIGVYDNESLRKRVKDIIYSAFDDVLQLPDDSERKLSYWAHSFEITVEIDEGSNHYLELKFVPQDADNYIQ